jgi:Na+-transporting methylmalonyl-CoA/oxaloacetate decarboxylase gamma subunit
VTFPPPDLSIRNFAFSLFLPYGDHGTLTLMIQRIDVAFVFIVVALLVIVVTGYMTVRSHFVGRFVHTSVDRKDRLISYVVENQDSQVSQLLRGSCKVSARSIILFDFQFDWEDLRVHH